MSPTKTNLNLNASESSRQRKVSTQRLRKAFKQRKIPKTLDGVPVIIYGAKMVDFMNGNATIQPPVVSEPVAPLSLHVTTLQDTVNLASPESYFPPAVHSQIPVSSTGVYRVQEPSHVPVPIPFQYDPDFISQLEAEDIFSLSNNLNPYQSYGLYDPSCHFSPPSESSSTGGLSMEHNAEPYQQRLPVDPSTQYFQVSPQPILSESYVSNGPSTFPGNDINADVTGSSHLTAANDGTTLLFPSFGAYNLHTSYYI